MTKIPSDVVKIEAERKQTLREDALDQMRCWLVKKIDHNRQQEYGTTGETSARYRGKKQMAREAHDYIDEMSAVDDIADLRDALAAGNKRLRDALRRIQLMAASDADGDGTATCSWQIEADAREALAAFGDGGEKNDECGIRDG